MNALLKAEVLWGLVRRKLTFFTWNVTNKCNEDCPMCEVIRRPAVDLTVIEAESILAQFRKAGFRSLGVTGGDPLLRPDILEILSLLDRIGFVYTLATNGTLVTPELAAGLARLKNLLQVAVSIDSLDPHRFEKLRGRPLLHQAIAGLDMLVAARPRGTVKVNFVLSRENVSELDAMLAFVRKKKVFLTVIPVVAGENGMIHRRNEPMFKADDAERLAMAEVFERLAGMRRAGEPIWDASHYHEMAAGLARGRMPGPCDAGRIMVELRADGGFAVCPDHPPIASLREVALTEAIARLPSHAGEVRRCHEETPCLYTCTFGITAISQKPLAHLREHRAVMARHARDAAS